MAYTLGSQHFSFTSYSPALHAHRAAHTFDFPLHKGRPAAQPCPLTNTHHTPKQLLLTSPRPEKPISSIFLPAQWQISLVPDVAALEQHAAAALPC